MKETTSIGLYRKPERLERIESELNEIGRSELIRRLEQRGGQKLLEKRSVNASANSIRKVISGWRERGGNDLVKSLDCNLQRIKCYNTRSRGGVTTRCRSRRTRRCRRARRWWRF